MKLQMDHQYKQETFDDLSSEVPVMPAYDDSFNASFTMDADASFVQQEVQTTPQPAKKVNRIAEKNTISSAFITQRVAKSSTVAF